VLADRNIEIHFGIAFVGLRLAQVPGRAAAAHHDTRKAPGPGVVEIDDADADIALLKNTVIGEQHFQIVARFEERIAEIPDIVDELRREILMNPAEAKIVGVHAGARGALVEAH